MAADGTTLRELTRQRIVEMGPVFDFEVLEATRALYAAHLDLSMPPGGEVRNDLAYGDHPRQRLDLYLSAQDRRGPLLVYVPGGGFVTGDKGGVRNLGAWFARGGVTTAVIDYRLAPDDPWPAGPQDVARAVDWTLAYLRGAGQPVGPVVLFGQSAGAAHAAGYLVGHGGTDPHAVPISEAILMNGVFEMTAALQQLPNLVQYFGADAALYRDRSPIHWMDRSRVPVSLSVGEFDPPMLATPFDRRTRELDERKRRVGHQVLPSSAIRKRSLRCAPSCGGITNSSFSTMTFTSRKTGPFLVRRSFTSWAMPSCSVTVPVSAMPQPLAIIARSVPAPESVGPLLRGLVWLA